MKTMLLRSCVAAALAALIPCAHALDLMPHGLSAQVSKGDRSVDMAGVGLTWDWDWERLRRAEVTLHTELLLNYWHAPAMAGGHDTIWQVALVPTLRMQLGRGASPWFAEVGVGPSYMNKLLNTPDRQFSTRWNFYDVLGGGYLFGDHRQHEVGVRLVHISNLGIKKPNPGQNFLQLRYVAHF
jgi:lipid A 3-O-deacylase